MLDTPHERARRGEDLLARGDYAEGFRLYDAWRLAYPDFAADWPLPSWEGESLNGRRFLVAGEQGFGDQIMFARFGKLLQEQGAEVIWLCQKPLARLFEQGMGIKTTRLGETIENISFYSPSSRLPNLFFPPLKTPPTEPYLKSPPPNIIPGLTIGVVTKGNPRFQHDASRSLSPEAAEILLSLPGAVSLLPEDTTASDFYDTATIIAGLDLVITVDTAAAHLAGAMGKPTWILLSAERIDWRWRHEAGIPWYPSARLFHQATPGDWSGVINEVTSALT